jgi:opacity protein-like surface antigen
MIRHGLAIAALTMGLASQAAAFDMPPPIDAPEIDTGSIAATTDGWYIRGDLGYNFSTESDKPTSRNFDFDTESYSTNTFDKARLSKDLTMNAGIGYQFNDFFRSDLTLDYFGSTLDGKTGWETCSPRFGNAQANCRYKQQDMTALSTLANGYVDLGTYWGMTPYIGAGAGVSYVKWGDVKQSMRCNYLDGSKSDCGDIDASRLAKKGADSWRFTYALMAGMSYDVADRIKIDFGYRFSQIDSGDMFGFNSYESDNGAFGMKGKDKGLTRHEFRTGIRVVNW